MGKEDPEDPEDPYGIMRKPSGVSVGPYFILLVMVWCVMTYFIFVN